MFKFVETLPKFASHHAYQNFMILTHRLLELFAKNAFFWTVWRFSGWIWAKLAPIYSKRHLQYDYMPFFPLASRFTTLLLGHEQKSKL